MTENKNTFSNTKFIDPSSLEANSAAECIKIYSEKNPENHTLSPTHRLHCDRFNSVTQLFARLQTTQKCSIVAAAAAAAAAVLLLLVRESSAANTIRNAETCKYKFNESNKENKQNNYTDTDINYNLNLSLYYLLL